MSRSDDGTGAAAQDIVYDAKRKISIDEAFELLGTGPFQHIMLVATGLCVAADSLEIMLLSFLSPLLEVHWQLSSWQSSTITSVVFAGAVLGTLILGPLGDRIGRRPVFILAAVIISVFGIATAAVPNFIGLLIIRFLVGFGVGGATVPFDVLAEFLPNETRGRYLLLIEYFWTAGSMLVPVLAWLTLERSPSSWRWFVLLVAIPCVISALLGICIVPESPRWLVAKGRTDEALQIIQRAAQWNGKDELANATDLELKRDEAAEQESSNFVDLFKPKWRYLTVLIWIAWFGFALAYYGTVIVETRVFESHYSDDDNDNNDDNDNDDARQARCDENGDCYYDNDNAAAVTFNYGAIFVSASAEIVGTALVISAIDRIGRVPSQVLAYGLGGVTLWGLCRLAHMQHQDDDDDNDNNNNGVPFVFSSLVLSKLVVVLAFVARVCEMMGSCVTWVITAEILSTEIRTTGHSAANAVARIGGFFSPYIVSSRFSYAKIGTVMLIVHAITALAASLLPETKGRPMGEAGTNRGSSSEDDAANTRNEADELSYYRRMSGSVAQIT